MVTHAFVSGKTDDSDASLVRPSNWNADHTITGIDAATSIWWHEYFIPAGAFAPGASGATWTDPSASTIGGYKLGVNTELLFYHSHVEPDWDGASDLKFEVYFEVNVNNTGGADTDTVDLKLLTYYKGEGETAMKTQTIEEVTVVGKSAQYKQFKVGFDMEWDKVSHVVEVSDLFSFCLNLETDTSEVDNIIVNYAEFKYKTGKPAPEV